MHIKSFVRRVEAEACVEGHMEAPARSRAFIFINKSGKLKYTVIFPHLR